MTKTKLFSMAAAIALALGSAAAQPAQANEKKSSASMPEKKSEALTRIIDAEPIDYYSYYDAGYDENLDNDWFYDFYTYGAENLSESGYGYFDAESDTFDWEETGLFE